MSSSEIKSTLNEALVNVDNSLEIVAENLKLACKSLRDIFVDNIVSKRFNDFREKILNYALIYREVVFPLIKSATSEIRSFMENYTILSFEQFRDDIDLLAEEINEKNDLFERTLKLHRKIQEDFKNLKDYFFNKLKNETQHSNESMKSVENLVKSIQGLVNALISIAQSFTALEGELKIIVDDNEKEDNKYYHYAQCKTKAQSIIDNCRIVTYEIPNCEADLSVLTSNSNDNFINSWLRT
ncbi:453_t:CDS:1 [Gigaspora margarita]|uniref:453_t:CDS:1 n=1 Tax=Gigaspora margarita TaxID=4874 RepID=A0ABN7UU21_GIGMA|nr:453_t:CDS:1 [Gigaspora margarita]